MTGKSENNSTKLSKLAERMEKSRNVRILLFTLILLAEIFTLINGNFLSSYNLVSIGQSLAPYAVLSLGAIFPIALGYTDLSSGAVLIGAAVFSGKLYALGLPLWAVIPAMILFGAVIGFLNGMMISKLKLPPFIVTLGTMMFIRGVTALFANQPNVLFPTKSWYNQIFSSFNGIPVGFIWVAILGAATAWFFRKSKTGRHILAVGSSEKAAVIAGLDAEKLTVTAFTISGLMAGIAAILWSASFATVTVATGNGMELDAIAGAYIGGSAAAGGSVSTIGAIIGAALLVVLRNGLNFVLAKLNVPLNSTYVTYAITGIIVVLAVFVDKKKEKRNRVPVENKRSVLNTFVLPAVAVLLAIAMIVSNIFIYNEQAKDNKTVAVLMKSEGVAFWDAVAAGAKDAADEYGYRLLIRGAESEDSSQLPKHRELLSVMLSEDPVGLGIATIANGYTDLLEEAYGRGIPVMEYDSGLYAEDAETIKTSDKNPLCGFVKGDNEQNAALVADEVFRVLRDRISLSESYTLGVIQHENSVTAASRCNGFKDRFMELAEADPDTAGKCTIYVEVTAAGDNGAYKAGLEALYEKGASMIFMTADLVTNQIYDAIAASGDKYDGMFFAGFDSSEKTTAWLKSEDAKAVFLCGVSQNPYMLGRLIIETLIRNAAGEPTDELTVVPGVVYTRENVDELIKKLIVN